MSRNPLKIRTEVLWLIAAAVVSLAEIYAAGGRERTLITAPFEVGDRPMPTMAPEIQSIGIIPAAANAAILVVGNPETDSGSDLLVTLRATRTPRTSPNHVRCADAASHTTLRPRLELQASLSSQTLVETMAPNGSQAADTHRVYFLQRRTQPANAIDGHVAVPCRVQRETARVRIFVDERLRPDSQLTQLVNAIAAAAESDLGGIVQEYAGHVSDVDRDGHLAIVVTAELAHMGSGPTPVDGLTRPADFQPGIDRPVGNCSDVIFLSSNLVPGLQLHAVLAHEWCHAAAFSRRGQRDPAVTRPAQDDWLNEALAHAVEVRAGRSDSNVAHRIRSFLSNSGKSPLVVRDYCQPEYWRHDGCRGAGYLFLESCLAAFGDSRLKNLINADKPGVAGLEEEFGQTFEQLFARWTRQLGEHLASGGVIEMPGFNSSKHTDQTVVAHQSWRLNGQHEQTMTIRLRATCVGFVRVEVPDDANWELSLSAIGGEAGSLQADLIPAPGH